MLLLVSANILRMINEWGEMGGAYSTHGRGNMRIGLW
jgi:hypothetical protein